MVGRAKKLEHYASNCKPANASPQMRQGRPLTA